MGFPHQCEFTRQGWKLDPWTCEFLPIIPFREAMADIAFLPLTARPKTGNSAEIIRLLIYNSSCKLCSPSQIGAKIPTKKRSAVPPQFRRSAHPKWGAPDKNGAPLSHVAGPATLNGCANRIRDEGTAHHLMDNGYGFV